MKKTMCLLFCIILLIPLILNTAYAEESNVSGNISETEINETKPLLSSLSEQECMDFLREQGVSIPTCFEEDDLAPFAKRIIAKVENDPNTPFAINYWVTLEFAEAIRDAVNEYYGRDTLSLALIPTQFSTLAATVLQDSVPYGEWSDDFFKFNCYAYSIAKDYWLDPGGLAYYEEQKDNTLAPEYSLDTLDASVLAGYVKDDLVTLGWSRFHIQDDPLDTDDMCSNEYVICVRSGALDYHFMRYYNGMWLHKPSYTQPLQYKYTPSNDREWTNESITNGVYRPYDIIYDGPIYYIRFNSHNFTSYTNHNTGTHTKYCSLCDYFESSSCDIEYVSNGSSGHYQSCALCGFRSSTTSHNYVYEYYSGTSHIGRCADCGYTTSGSSCTKVTEYTGDGTTHTHHEVCSVCEHEYTSASCSIQYAYHSTVSGSNYHYRRCAACGYIANSPMLCTYKGTSTTCTLCGVQKGFSSAGPLSSDP